MGQRFQITESERKRIKSLYEQQQPTNEYTIDYTNIFIPIDSLTFYVKDNHGNDFNVDIINTGNEFEISEIIHNDPPEDDEAERIAIEEVRAFMEKEFDNSLIVNLPTYINFNKLRGEVTDVDLIQKFNG